MRRKNEEHLSDRTKAKDRRINQCTIMTRRREQGSGSYSPPFLLLFKAPL